MRYLVLFVTVGALCLSRTYAGVRGMKDTRGLGLMDEAFSVQDILHALDDVSDATKGSSDGYGSGSVDSVRDRVIYERRQDYAQEAAAAAKKQAAERAAADRLGNQAKATVPPTIDRLGNQAKATVPPTIDHQYAKQADHVPLVLEPDLLPADYLIVMGLETRCKDLMHRLKPISKTQCKLIAEEYGIEFHDLAGFNKDYRRCTYDKPATGAQLIWTELYYSTTKGLVCGLDDHFVISNEVTSMEPCADLPGNFNDISSTQCQLYAHANGMTFVETPFPFLEDNPDRAGYESCGELNDKMYYGLNNPDAFPGKFYCATPDAQEDDYLPAVVPYLGNYHIVNDPCAESEGSYDISQEECEALPGFNSPNTNSGDRQCVISVYTEDVLYAVISNAVSAAVGFICTDVAPPTIAPASLYDGVPLPSLECVCEDNDACPDPQETIFTEKAAVCAGHLAPTACMTDYGCKWRGGDGSQTRCYFDEEGILEAETVSERCDSYNNLLSMSMNDLTQTTEYACTADSACKFAQTSRVEIDGEWVPYYECTAATNIDDNYCGQFGSIGCENSVICEFSLGDTLGETCRPKLLNYPFNSQCELLDKESCLSVGITKCRYSGQKCVSRSLENYCTMISNDAYCEIEPLCTLNSDGDLCILEEERNMNSGCSGASKTNCELNPICYWNDMQCLRSDDENPTVQCSVLQTEEKVEMMALAKAWRLSLIPEGDPRLSAIYDFVTTLVYKIQTACYRTTASISTEIGGLCGRFSPEKFSEKYISLLNTYLAENGMDEDEVDHETRRALFMMTMGIAGNSWGSYASNVEDFSDNLGISVPGSAYNPINNLDASMSYMGAISEQITDYPTQSPTLNPTWSDADLASFVEVGEVNVTNLDDFDPWLEYEILSETFSICGLDHDIDEAVKVHEANKDCNKYTIATGPDFVYSDADLLNEWIRQDQCQNPEQYSVSIHKHINNHEFSTCSWNPVLKECEAEYDARCHVYDNEVECAHQACVWKEQLDICIGHGSYELMNKQCYYDEEFACNLAPHCKWKVSEGMCRKTDFCVEYSNDREACEEVTYRMPFLFHGEVIEMPDFAYCYWDVDGVPGEKCTKAPLTTSSENTLAELQEYMDQPDYLINQATVGHLASEIMCTDLPSKTRCNAVPVCEWYKHRGGLGNGCWRKDTCGYRGKNKCNNNELCSWHYTTLIEEYQGQTGLWQSNTPKCLPKTDCRFIEKDDCEAHGLGSGYNCYWTDAEYYQASADENPFIDAWQIEMFQNANAYWGLEGIAEALGIDAEVPQMSLVHQLGGRCQSHHNTAAPTVNQNWLARRWENWSDGEKALAVMTAVLSAMLVVGTVVVAAPVVTAGMTAAKAKLAASADGFLGKSLAGKASGGALKVKSMSGTKTGTSVFKTKTFKGTDVLKSSNSQATSGWKEIKHADDWMVDPLGQSQTFSDMGTMTLQRLQMAGGIVM